MHSPHFPSPATSTPRTLRSSRVVSITHSSCIVPTSRCWRLSRSSAKTLLCLRLINQCSVVLRSSSSQDRSLTIFRIPRRSIASSALQCCTIRRSPASSTHNLTATSRSLSRPRSSNNLRDPFFLQAGARTLISYRRS